MTRLPCPLIAPSSPPAFPAPPAPPAPPTPRPLRHGLRVATLAFATAAMAAGAAGPGPLADPTRPPAAQGGATAFAARLGGAAAPRLPFPAAPPAPLPVLQSVQLPAQGPAVVMIDGRLFKAGDSVDGRRVLSIDSQGLVLDSRGGGERVWLLAGSPKQAPGSILALRSASYLPATPAPDAADSGGTPVRADSVGTPQRTERSASPSPPPASPGPLSVAGRNPP